VDNIGDKMNKSVENSTCSHQSSELSCKKTAELESKSLIAKEKRAYERRPRSELCRTVLALKVHAWQNTPVERARLIAVEQLLERGRNRTR